MGAHLTQPVLEKTSHDESHNHLEFGVSGMQGWRVSMEDAHCTIPDVDGKKNSLFGVFDGHGGDEVAIYCAENIHKFLLDCDDFMEGNIKSALKDSFMNIDHAMTTDEVIEELKTIAGINDNPAEDEENEVAMLLEEASIPKEELLARFKENVKEKLRECGMLEEEDEEEEEEEEKAPEENEEKEKMNGKVNGHSESNGASSGGGSSSGSAAATEEEGSSSGSGSKKTTTKEIVTEGEETEEDPDFESADGTEEDEDEDEGSEEDSEDEDDDEEDEFEDGAGMDFQPGREEPGKDTGTTAIVALVYNNKLYVANVGDSRCVLCRNGKTIEMSQDHKPEDEVEKNRVEAAGAKITEGRVNGGLNMTRALGDHVYKQNKDLPPEKQAITALPDIEEIELNKDDEFMVLACDGIWNVMTSEEVIEFVKEKLQENEKTDEKTRLSKICEELFDRCVAPDTNNDGTGCDNMTCMIVRFNHDQMFNGHKKRELSEDVVEESKQKSKKAKLT